MMKRFLFLLICGILLLSACACGISQKPVQPETGESLPSGGKKGEKMDFQSIKLSENSMMAYETVYYAEKTDSGVRLEYYMSGSRWDNEKGESVEDKIMIHSLDGDAALYEEIAALAGSCDLKSWNGFHGENPEGVLDGHGFRMEAVLADGTEVEAYGSNNFPDTYFAFSAPFSLMMMRQEITETTFETEDYMLQLPESWIGNVTAVYFDGYTAFEVQTDVQNRTILCLYNEPYDYGNGGEEYVLLSTYEKDGQTWYLEMRRGDESRSAYNEMNEKQKAICDQLDEDMVRIKESVVLK